MNARTKQERLDACTEAMHSIGDARIALADAGLMSYEDGDPIYDNLVGATDLLHDLRDSIQNEVEWSGFTKESWRLHGTVIVANTDDEWRTEYALDPDFKIKGNHYVWLDGYRRFKSSTGGGWCRVK